MTETPHLLPTQETDPPEHSAATPGTASSSARVLREHGGPAQGPPRATPRRQHGDRDPDQRGPTGTAAMGNHHGRNGVVGARRDSVDGMEWGPQRPGGDRALCLHWAIKHQEQYGTFTGKKHNS